VRSGSIDDFSIEAIAAPRARRTGRGGGLAVILLLAVVMMLFAAFATSSARAEDCHVGANGALGDYGYDAACGPEYQSPSWGDAAGWTDPSQYSTIKLADITGNGQDELLARSSTGLEIWWFDTSLGQWRPATGANGRPEVLTEFRNPLPTESGAGLGTDPMVYSSIQTADVDGNGRLSIIAQFPDGVHTFDYTPPAGGKSIVGGTWHQEPVGGPSGGPPSEYLSLHVVGTAAAVNGKGTIPATLVDQSSYWVHQASGGWTAAGDTTNVPNTTQPKYYLDYRTGVLPRQTGPSAFQQTPVNLYRTPDGVVANVYDGRPGCSDTHECDPVWYSISSTRAAAECESAPGTCPPLADNGSPDCDPDTFSCFGSSPSWYETMQTASQLRGPDDDDGYLLGRLYDGLHVYTFDPSSQLWDRSLPVLKALADPSNAFAPPGEWSSIRTGDVTGDGRTDVLALVNGQLKAWELEPNGSGGWAWSELPAEVPLNLGQAFEGALSQASTIQVGPVAGAGHADGVIARGPFGIRTWFYCPAGKTPVPGCADLQGQSGWASYDPQGTASYPQYAGGEAAAWKELNALAHNPPPPGAPLIDQDDTTVRDVWTAMNPPTDDQLAALSSGVQFLGQCTAQSGTDPLQFGTCKLPNGATTFDKDAWTAVINDTLADIYYAKQVLAYYRAVDSLRQVSFLTDQAELPAISDKVLAALQGAAGNTALVSPMSLYSAIVGIAGAVGGLEYPNVGAALSVASYVFSTVPSASSDDTGSPTSETLAGLRDELARSITQGNAAEIEQSFEVRQNFGLLRLIGQLTSLSGAWHSVDTAGLESSMNEGYALYAYQKLLPTVYDRYVISNCDPKGRAGDSACTFTGFNGSIGGPTNFTTLEPPPSTSYDPSQNRPCYYLGSFICHYDDNPAPDIASQVWGPVSNDCNYIGKPLTIWTYGCNLGVDPSTSTALAGNSNGWNFATCSGSSSVDGTNCKPPATATVGADGNLDVTLSTRSSNGFEVKGATLVGKRLLFEPRGAGALLSRGAGSGVRAAAVTAKGGGGLGTIHLTTPKGATLGSSGGLLTGSGPGNAKAALVVKSHTGRSASPGTTTLRLKLSGVDVSLPDACQQVPASTSLASPRFVLDSGLVISDGHRARTLTVPVTYKCVRGRGGAVIGLRAATPRPPQQRPGLAVSISGPRKVRPGSAATYRVRLRNTRRRPKDRVISSLWNVAAALRLTRPAGAGGRTLAVRRVKELRRGKSKTLRIRVDLPARLRHSVAGRVCVSVLAGAESARPAAGQTCASRAKRPVGRG
jgi:hypothetical protein